MPHDAIINLPLLVLVYLSFLYINLCPIPFSCLRGRKRELEMEVLRRIKEGNYVGVQKCFEDSLTWSVA